MPKEGTHGTEAHDDGDNEEAHEVLLLRNRRGSNDVVTDGNECAVIEERDKHQQGAEKKEVGPRFARDLLMKIIFPNLAAR